MKLKGGRPKGSKGRGYNYHSQTKAKLTANRVIKDKQKKIASAAPPKDKITGADFAALRKK